MLTLTFPLLAGSPSTDEFDVSAEEYSVNDDKYHI